MSRNEDHDQPMLALRPREPKPAPAPRKAAPRKGRLAGMALASLGGMSLALWVWLSPAPSTQPPSMALPTADPPPPKSSVAAGPQVPLASVSELLKSPRASDWQWHRLRDNPRIFVIEFPGLTEQGLAFNRVAAMYEKRGGRRDRVLPDTELAQLLLSSGDNVASFYQGHDYPADALATFFSLAAAQQVPLNAQETRLRTLLVDAAVLKPKAGAAFSALGPQAVISFTGTQADDPGTPPDETIDAVRRESVLVHELSHGEYFTNAAYRVQCWDFWRKSLSKRERDLFKRYLDGLEYDIWDEELMANETQAVLMHTPDPRAFNAGSLGVTEAELAALRARFRTTARSAQGPKDTGR